ncbi:dnaJ homolog subfamily C member 7-like [Actinia tenebrosa]|uniref:DnaJ homolog subfamily C member 7-like n=1 Tax=Actinia tenebrosa TaxID=6105 RepID=A0A6P8I1P4_ACTTE|nr:dnaJ homolog subfamily C member 7-like [Actinia tenebrosa]
METGMEVDSSMDQNESAVKNATQIGEPMDVDQKLPRKDKDPIALAEAKKAEGNKEYAKKNYDQAVRLYTEAIELAPDVATFYGNRSAAYMMLMKYDKALEDSLMAIKLDNSFVKGHYRVAKCYLALGLSRNAVMELQKVLALDKKNKDATNDLKTANLVMEYESSAYDAFEKKDYRKVVFCMRNALEKCPACTIYKVMKAEALALTGKYSDAEHEATDILRTDSANTDAIYVRGLCLYYQDNVEKAYQHFIQVMKRDPDHKKARILLKKAKSLQAKKKEGNDAFGSGQYQKAYDLYTEALEIDPLNKYTNAKIYYNRAVVGSKINKMEQAIEDCTKAVELDNSYTKAYLKRANCYMDCEKYEEAVRDYELLCRKDRNSREYRRLLEKAKLELKKSKRKDYYKILGISKTATDDEIKKAYKKEALKHHPDRHSGATDEDKKKEEHLFKEVNEAYSILSDPKKRSQYDSGQDLEDSFGMHEDFDPNSIFQAFFGGPGGFMFNFGGPGGGPSGFPGHGGGGYSRGGHSGFNFTYG